MRRLGLLAPTPRKFCKLHPRAHAIPFSLPSAIASQILVRVSGVFCLPVPYIVTAREYALSTTDRLRLRPVLQRCSVNLSQRRMSATCSSGLRLSRGSQNSDIVFMHTQALCELVTLIVFENDAVPWTRGDQNTGRNHLVFKRPIDAVPLTQRFRRLFIPAPSRLTAAWQSPVDTWAIRLYSLDTLLVLSKRPVSPQASLAS